MTIEHLKNLGYDNQGRGLDKLRKVFKKSGTLPEGIIFNSTLSVGSPNYNNYAGFDPNASLFVTGPETLEIPTEQSPDDVFVIEVVNASDEKVEEIAKYSYKQGFKTIWQRKFSGSVKLGYKAKVNLFVADAEVSTEVTIGGEITDGTETSNEVTKEADTKVIIPPHSKKTIRAFTKTVNKKVGYTVRTNINGHARTNYPLPVHHDAYSGAGNHYFWSDDLNEYPEFTIGVNAEKGEVTATKYLEVHVYISPAEPL